MAEGAPQLHESAPGNQAFHWKFANGDVDGALATAEVVLKAALHPAAAHPQRDGAARRGGAVESPAWTS